MGRSEDALQRRRYKLNRLAPLLVVWREQTAGQKMSSGHAAYAISEGEY